jgi:hypothetical protein
MPRRSAEHVEPNKRGGATTTTTTTIYYFSPSIGISMHQTKLCFV